MIKKLFRILLSLEINFFRIDFKKMNQHTGEK